MFGKDRFAKVWEFKNITEKYTDARISTSRKNKVTEEYEQDFGGYVRFVGKANTDIQKLHEGDSFKIGNCGVENTYDKEKQKTYYNFVIFDIEESDGFKKVDDADNPYIKK